MPFKSKDQVKACFAQDDPRWNCKKWARETKSIKSLPENLPDKMEKKAAVMPQNTVRKAVDVMKEALRNSSNGPEVFAKRQAVVSRSSKGGLYKKSSIEPSKWLDDYNLTKIASGNKWLTAVTGQVK